MSMVDERIAEPNPQLGIPGIFADGILKQANGVLGVPAARETVGQSEPGFFGTEIAEKSVARCAKRYDFASL